MFEGNVACSKGGGVYQGMNGSNTKPAILIKNTIFKNNEASTGGGYYTDGQGRKNYTYITDSEFTDNIVKATGHYMEFGIPVGGGLLSAGNVPMVVNNTTFTGNIADPEGDYSAGGGLYFAGEFESYPIKIVDSTFTNNSALEGGAIYIQNADTAIIADTKDVVFSGNTAGADEDDYNGGGDMYFDTSSYAATLSLNAADGKKVVFNGSVAACNGSSTTGTVDINKDGVSYDTYDGTTETAHDAGTSGEIQFNNRVGDENHSFDINLYGGKLSIGQDSTAANPDGLINDNNFTVAGDGTLNTANGIIGEFSPVAFAIDSALSYQLDVDLANGTIDKLVGATIGTNGRLDLAVLNIISDADVKNLKLVYSDTNIGGVLKNDYIITTSEVSYEISAENDDTGSYLLISKYIEVTGLPKAIKDAAATYEITADEGEVVAEWAENDLKADLAISGNDKAITTENQLDGINVGSSYTLSMEDVSDVNGFNYAVNNEGVLNLSRSKISDEIINNGTMEINENVTLGEVSGAGVTNVNADFAVAAAFGGNTLNVKNATLSGAENLANDVALNLLGGTLDLANQTVTIKSASFDEGSILNVAINSVNDFGTITATDIAVAEGAKLKITLAEDLLAAGESTSLQLLTAENFAIDNFAPEFESEIYSIEKDADHVGAYIITLAKDEPDPEPTPDPDPKPVPAGLSGWVGRADVAWSDGQFAPDSKAADVARKLTALSQNSAQLAKALKTLAPMQTNTAELVATSHFDRLFRLVEQQQDETSALGMSAGDALQDVRIWGRAYLGKATLDKRGSAHGADFDSQGVVAAIEKKLNHTTRIGGGLQFDRTDIDASNRKIDTSSIYGFAYAKYQPSQWFVDGAVSYGKSEYDEKKFALGSTFKAKYDVNVASLAAVIGYQFDWLAPEAGLRYYHIKQDSYTDTAQQHVSSINDNLLRAVAGVRLRHDFSKLTAKAYLGLTYDVQRDNDNIYVGLANGSHYVVPEKHLPRLGYEFNLDLTTQVSDNVTVGVGYMGSYRQDYQEHTGMLMLKYNF